MAFNRSVFEIIQKVLGWIILLAPLGMIGLIGNAVATYGNRFFLPLLNFTAAVYLGCALVLFAVYPLLLRFVARISPRRFFARSWTALQFAFASGSSGATLPLSRQSAVNLGVPPSYANFAVPLGTTTKMDGCASVYPAVAAIFIANLFGIDPILNMMRTMTNVGGQITVPLVVSRSEGILDDRVLDGETPEYDAHETDADQPREEHEQSTVGTPA